MTLRAELHEALSTRLVPELKRRGFSGPDEIGGNAILHDFTRTLLCSAVASGCT
jgi:hypothetical protein